MVIIEEVIRSVVSMNLSWLFIKKKMKYGAGITLQQAPTTLLLVVGAVVVVLKLVHLTEAAHQIGPVGQMVIGCPFNITGLAGGH